MFLVHRIVYVLDHLVEDFLVLRVALEDSVEEVGVGEEDEDGVEPLHRLLLEVVLHELAEVRVRLLQRREQVLPVVREVYLVEAEDGHSRRVKLHFEPVRARQVRRAQLVVAVQHSDLDHCLDYVLHQLLRLFFAVRLEAKLSLSTVYFTNVSKCIVMY